MPATTRQPKTSRRWTWCRRLSAARAPLRRQASWVLFCLLFVSLHASEYLVRNWTTGDGLPENTVRAIVETRDGYLWMGTANGLARFDGVRFTRFDTANTPGLFAADIFAMAEDPQGGLWLLTRRGALRYFQGRFEAMPRPQDKVSGLLKSLCRSPAGELWVGVGDGLARWTGGQLEPVAVPAGPAQITDQCVGLDGSVWLAARNGLWRLRDGQLERMAADPAPTLIVPGLDNRIWGLVNDRQLFQWKNGAWSEAASLGGERCNSLYGAADGDVWIGAATRNRAFRFRQGELTEVNEKNGLEGNRAICFIEDREGNLWIGMNGAGVYRLRERRLEIYRREHGLRNLSLASLCQDRAGTVFVNVMGQTLHQMAGGRFEAISVVSDEAVFEYPTALAAAAPGGVWAGTYFGKLPRVEQGRVVERIGVNGGTRALFQDREGGLWRGTRTAGVEYFHGTNYTHYTTNEGLSFNNVYCLAQDRRGALWAGTEEGLNEIREGHIRRFGRADGLGHHFVTALCVDSRGMLWAGTLGGGLSGWNGARFTTLRTEHGLADDAVQQLLEDDFQQLWIGTRAGLMRVSLDHLHGFLEGRQTSITGTLIGRNEGLARPDCWTEYQPAGLKDRDGQLWFCTSSGLVKIDPRPFARQAPPPKVRLEEMRVDERSTSFPAVAPPSFTIPAGTQRIEIRYTGLSPSSPELLRFVYRLEGYDRKWVQAGASRFAGYAHLPPGHYTFRVKAANNDGVWSEALPALALVVQPTFWQTSWFRGAVFLFFLGLGPALHRWRMRKLEDRRRAQEEFARRLIDSQEQERKRIAAELHDSLGQNLLVIKNRAALALNQPNHPEQMTKQIQEVSNLASASLREVREIAQNLRPYQIDELGLTKSLEAMARKLGDSSPIQFRTELENIDGALPPEFEINFYRIVQECLNNIVKHSQAASATVRLQRKPRALHLTVSDDGRGFNQAHVPPQKTGGFGLNSISERALTMGGHATVTSRPAEGTRIEIEVPIAG